jgi:hypothetical protein
MLQKKPILVVLSSKKRLMVPRGCYFSILAPKSHLMKTLTLTLLLLCGLYSFAQTGFIEVEVTDTVWMKPVSFDYNVLVKQDVYAVEIYADVDSDEQQLQQDDKQQKLQTLKSFLGKKGYTAKPAESGDFNLFSMGREVKEGFTVTVKTAEQLEKLKAEVKALDYAEGNMGTVNYGDKTVYDARIYKKLIDSARKKAQTISGLSGQKLGRVIEVKEPAPAAGGMGGIMDLYMKEMGRAFDTMGKLKKDDKGRLYGELGKTIMVRFAAE